MTSDLEKFRDKSLGREKALADREQVIRALNQVSDDAIVVITGKGGCGKSMALWQLLRTAVDPRSGSPRLAHLVRSTPRAPLSFGELVDKLRGIPTAQPDDEVALRRIKAANPKTQPPLLLLGWDGVDQIHSFDNWHAATRRIIEFFWDIHQEHKDSGKRPPARLLVSCRRREEFEDHIATITGSATKGKSPLYVELDVFTDSELASLALAMDGPGTARLLAALGTSPMPSLGSNFPSQVGPQDTAARTSISILRQPIMWRCFCELPADLQVTFLNGDSEALTAVAASYLAWFGQRVHQRRGLDEQDVYAALHAVAHAFPSVTGANNRAEFYERLNTIFRSDAESQRLYSEGIGSGLLDEVSPPGGPTSDAQFRWRWRHSFVVEHLLRS